MKRKQRDGLIPIGEVFGGLDGPVKALREAPPPARRGFTVADQVNQLVSASEADHGKTTGSGESNSGAWMGPPRSANASPMGTNSPR